jgi:PAS domain S-box-containing protein
MAYFLITLASFLFAYLAFRYEKLVIRNNAILEHYNEELESELKKRTAQLNKQKKQLEESEFRWKFAVDGRGDGLWDWNVDTNEVYFSKAWKEMLGFKEDEIQGSLEEWKKRVHPDDLEKVYEDINSHMNGETEVYSNEHRVMCKDGSYKWVHDRGIVVQRNEKGRPTRLIGTHTDITLRKETEFKMQQALIVYENTNEGIMITNSKNEIIDVNHSFCKTTGYSYEEVIGKNPSILKSNIKESDFYRQMWQELKDNGSWHGEITNKKKNGELYEEYLNINTIKNNDGTVINYIGIFSDVSVLKQQEKMILQQARTSAIGEMIGNIAHQWRQPLSAISTASTGLKVQLEMDMEISKEETIESLEKINSQTQFL